MPLTCHNSWRSKLLTKNFHTTGHCTIMVNYDVTGIEFVTNFATSIRQDLNPEYPELCNKCGSVAQASIVLTATEISPLDDAKSLTIFKPWYLEWLPSEYTTSFENCFLGHQYQKVSQNEPSVSKFCKQVLAHYSLPNSWFCTWDRYLSTRSLFFLYLPRLQNYDSQDFVLKPTYPAE